MANATVLKKPRQGKMTRLVSKGAYDKPITLNVPETGINGNPYGMDGLARELCTIIRLQYQERRDRLDRVEEWRRQHDASITTDSRVGPYYNAANVATPMTRDDVVTLHAHMMRVITGVDPYLKVKASKLQDTDNAELIEDFLQFSMESYIHFGDLMDKVLTRALIDGTCITYDGWCREYGTKKERRTLDDDLLSEMGYESKLEVRDKTGRPIAIIDGDKRYEEGSTVLIEHTPLIKDNPQAYHIDIRDFVMYPVAAPSIDKSVLKGHRIYKTKNDLLRGVRDGLYDKEAVDKVIARTPNFWNNFRQSHGGSVMGWEEAQDIGLNVGDTILSGKHDPYETYQIVYLFDTNEDGIEEDCLFVVDYTSQTIIRAIPLPYWDGSHHYTAYNPIPRTDSVFGYSLPEILEQLQWIHNILVDQRLDNGNLANSPIITELETSTTNLSKTRLRLGEVYRVREHDDIKIQPLTVPNQTTFMDIDLIERMSQSASGVSDATAGIQAQRQTAVGEIQAVLEQAGYKFQDIIDRIQRSNVELGNHIISLYRQYLTEDREFAVSGRTGIFKTISPDSLQIGLTITAHGNTINTNRDLEMQSAEKLVMLSERSPFMQKPTRLYQIQKEFLRSIGRRNYETFLGTPEEAKQMEESPSPPGIPPELSGKLDETVSLAYALQSNPGLEQLLIKASQLSQSLGIGEAGDVAAQKAQALSEINLNQQFAANMTDFQKRMALAELKGKQALASQELSNKQNNSIMAIKNALDAAKGRSESTQQDFLHRTNLAATQAQQQAQAAGQSAGFSIASQVQQGTHKLALAAQKAQLAKQQAQKVKANNTSGSRR